MAAILTSELGISATKESEANTEDSEFLNLVNEKPVPKSFKTKPKPGPLKIELLQLHDTPSTSSDSSASTSQRTIKSINIGFTDLSYSVKDFLTRGNCLLNFFYVLDKKLHNIFYSMKSYFYTFVYNVYVTFYQYIFTKKNDKSQIYSSFWIN